MSCVICGTESGILNGTLCPDQTKTALHSAERVLSWAGLHKPAFGNRITPTVA